MATIRISIDGTKKTYKDWAKDLKIPEGILRTRYALGLRGEALKRRARPRGVVSQFMGAKGTVQELAKRFKVDYHMMWCAVKVASKVQRSRASK